LTPPRDSDHKFHGDWVAYQKALEQMRVQNYRAQQEINFARQLPCAPAIGVHRPYCECSMAAAQKEGK